MPRAVSGARKLRSGADDLPPGSGEELRPILWPRITVVRLAVTA